MTYRFIVVAEDELGFRLARDVADRVIRERAASWLRALWQDPASRDQQRRWTGFHGHERWSSRGEIKRLAERHSIRAHGHGMKAERAMAYKAAQIAAKLAADGTIEPFQALFLVHDTDGDAGTARSLHEGAARRQGSRRFETIVAAPHPESEAWVIAGAPLRSPEERAGHEAVRVRLGFDPVTCPERLSSNRSTDKRDAKRVCTEIAGPSGLAYETWEPLWVESPLEILERNAERAGLREYIRQIEEVVRPMLGDQAPLQFLGSRM